MRTYTAALAALVILMGSGAHADAQPAATDGTPSGRALYEASCATCHGPDGRGMARGHVGFDLAIPDFTDCAFATPEPDGDWFSVIQHGGPARAFDRRMPAFRDALTDDEIHAILRHVRTLCTDPAWPRGELNLPRPLRTEKAYPENEAVLTTTFNSAGPNGLNNEFLYERRIGSRTQWEVKVPIALQGTETQGWQRGLGDIAFGLKRVLGHSLERGYILSAGGEIIFPTGKEDRGIGSGTTIFEPFLVFGQILPHDSFVQVHAAVELPADTRAASREAFWRLAAGRTFAQNGGAGRAWSPMVEVLAARDLRSGARVHWDLVPQVQITLNTRQHIMLNGGVQVPVNNRTGRGTRVMMYLLWDWWDGGLFDGW